MQGRLQPQIPATIRVPIAFPARYSFAFFLPENPLQTNPPVQWWLFSPQDGNYIPLSIHAVVVRLAPCASCRRDGLVRADQCGIDRHPCGRCRIMGRACTFLSVDMIPGQYHWGPDVLAQLNIQPRLPTAIGQYQV